MKKEEKTQQQSERFYTRAMVDKNTIVEKDDERSFWVVFATETPVFRKGWDENFNEILLCSPENVRATRLQEGAVPLLNNHDQSEGVDGQMGRAVEFKIEKGKCTARVLFSTQQKFDGIWGDIKAGVIRSISTGYNVYKYLREVTDEQTVPDYKAVDWEPLELSLAPVPADPKSLIGRKEGIQIDNPIQTQTSSNSNTMTEEQKTAQKAERKRSAEIFKLVRAANLTDDYAQELLASEMTIEQVRTAVEEKKAAAPKQEQKPVHVDLKEIAAAERKRIAEIQRTAKVAGIADNIFVEKLIEDGTPLEEARTAIIDKAAAADTANPAPHSGIRIATVGRDEADRYRDAATVGMCLRSGQVKENEFKPEQIIAARSFQGTSMIRLAADCLMRAGINISATSDMDIAKRAITTSTSDFPVILENVLHKMLLADYAIVPDTWRLFCTVGSVTDFRPQKRLRPGSMSRLDKVGENGELKNKKINDATSESVAAETYGNIVNISRNTIINDDLGYFAQITSDLGRAAKRSIEIDVYALLAENSGDGPTMSDGKALFHTDHANKITGAVPSVASFDAIKVAMKKQKDHNSNDFLDIRPSILLLGSHQSAAADAINDSQYDPDATNKLQKKNTSYKTFDKIVDTARISGNEQYAFADPSVLPVLEVSFLNGVQTPYLEQQQSFEQLGLSWRTYFDYGVGAVDWKGAIKNPGA